MNENFTRLIAKRIVFILLMLGFAQTMAQAQTGNTLNAVGLSSSTPAAAAYSMRLLSSNYTGPLARITTDNGNYFYDVYPDDSGKFSLNSHISDAYYWSTFTDAPTGSTSAVLSDVINGSTTAHLYIWFDQSGNGINAKQDNLSQQPVIITNGVINTQGDKPALKFTEDNGSYLETANGISINGASSVSAVAQNIDTRPQQGAPCIVTQVNDNLGVILGLNGRTSMFYGGIGEFGYAITPNTNFYYPTTPFIATGTYGNSAVNLFVNGDIIANNPEVPANVNGNGPIRIGRRWDLGDYFDGHIPELIIFSSELTSSLRATVEGNQSAYYGITVSRAPATQTITFNTLPAKITGDADFSPGATSDNTGVQITYSSDNHAVATIIDGNIHIVGAGTANITASQAADATHLVATDVVQQLTVTQAPQTVALTIPAAAAYSMRLLNNTYAGPLARITTDNGNYFYDVYPDESGKFSLDSHISDAYYWNSFTNPPAGSTSAILSSVINSSITAHVFIWFDQSGNGNDARQDNLSQQPEIISNGVIHTEGGKPALKFSANNGSFFTSVNGVSISGASSVSAVAQNINTSQENSGTPCIVSQTHDNLSVILGAFGGQSMFYGTIGDQGYSVTPSSNVSFPTAPFVATGTYGGTTVNLFVNGAALPVKADAAAGVTGNSQIRIGRRWDLENYFDGYIPEVIVFASELSTSQRAGIESNQFAYYGITPAGATPLIAQTITFAALPATVFGHADFAAGATSDNTAIPITYSSDNTAVATIVNGNIHIVSAGTVNITASQLADATHLAATDVVQQLTITKATQTITFTALPAKVFGDADFAAGATSDNTATPITYSSDNTVVATIVAGKIHIIKPGTAIITAIQSADATYTAATPVTQSLTVNKGEQTITGHDVTASLGDTGVDMGAVASSGLPVTYNYTSMGIGVISPDANGKFDIIGAAYLDIFAHQAGDEFYNVAPDVTLHLNIEKGDIIVTIPPETVAYGDVPVLAYTFTGGNTLTTVTGELGYNGPTTAPGVYDIDFAMLNFGPNYNVTFEAGGSLTIAKAPLTITIDNQTKIAGYPNPPFTYHITGFKNGENEANLVTPGGLQGGLIPLITNANADSPAGSYFIAPAPVSSDNYDITIVAGALSVTRAPIVVLPQTITFASLPAKAYDDGDFNPGATSDNTGIPITYTSSNTAVATIVNGNIHLIKPGTVTITATQDGDDTHTAAELKTQVLTVEKATQTITFAALPEKTYADGDFSPGATSDNTGVQITYSSDNHAVATIVDGSIHIVSAGTANITASQAADATHLAASDVVQQLTIIKAPQTITFSSLPAKVFGDADFAAGATSDNTGVQITYSSDNHAVATIIDGNIHIVGAGTANITASQAADATHLVATDVVQQLTVTQAPQTVALTIPAAAAYSMRLLNDTYTGPLARITTDNGNYFYDVYPDESGKFSLDSHISDAYYWNSFTNPPAGSTSAILSSVINSSITAHVFIWFDQSGNGNDARQDNLSQQPEIISNGVIHTEGGKPALKFSANNGSFFTSVNGVSISGASSVSAVAQNINTSHDNSGTPCIVSQTGGNLSVILGAFGGQSMFYGTIGDQGYSVTPSSNVSFPTAPFVATGTYGGTTVNLFVNGAALPVKADAAAGVTGNSQIRIGRRWDLENYFDGYIPEVIVFASELSTSQRAGIESNQFAYYGITPAGATPLIAQTITFAALPATVFGHADFAAGATSDNTAIPITYSSDNTAVATIVNGNIHIVSAGTANITAIQSADAIHSASVSVTQQLIVNGAPLTITANDQEITFGDNLPALTASYSGFLGTDNADSLTTKPVIATTGTATPAVGTYSITASGATSANYSITYVDGTLTVRTNVNLAALKASAGNLSPVFDAAVVNYTITVANAVAGITLTPTSVDASATITVNGATVISDAASAPIALSIGNNPVTVAVTPSAGGSTKTYTVTVIRLPALSSIATLSNLRSSAGTLTAVAGASRAYAVSVAYNTNTATITAVPADADASITVNGVPVAANTASQPIALVPGANTATVLVTAADGVATRIYTITITRALPGIATLSDLRSSAGKLIAVAGASRAYAVSVAYNTNTATITAVPADAGASITVNGVPVAANTASQPIALVPGANTATVLVTAADGVATRIYTVTITRALSNIATLTALRSSAGPLTVVAGNNYGYTVSVAYNTNTATITAVPADAGASITVNGVPVAANTASQPIALVPGANTATVLVTAADGVATRTYTVTITRALYANIATLSALRSSAGKLTAVGGPNHEYTVSVGATVNTATVTAVPADANASITVNGVPVAANVASQPIALNTGPNTVSVIVLAEDGVATRTYTVTITKASPPSMAAIPTKQTGIEVLQKTEPTVDALPELVVKQALSPNGDGVNDRFTIEGISAFPDNTLRIMNRNGEVIYQAKGYDNLGQSFDGHSSKGTMQQPGTYFYSIEYKAGDTMKRKSGYLVIKY